MNFRMYLQIGLYDFSLMGTRLIPNQNEGTWNVAPEMFQSVQHFFGIDRTIKMSFVNLARNRQADHRRCFSTKSAQAFQLRGLAFGCPGEANRLRIGEPKFIFKEDLGAEPLRFFLSWANPALAKPGSTLHRAQWHADPVFEHSSPGHVAAG